MVKKLVIGLVVVLLAVLAIGFYWWRQLTALPDWYTEDAAQLELAEDADGAGPQPLVWVPVEDPTAVGERGEDEPAKAAPTRRKKPKRERYEMRGFHRTTKAGAPKAVKASRAVLDEGKLEAGVVLDLSELPLDKLSPRDRELHRKVISEFPGLARRDVYVGLEDRPVNVDGILQLGSDPVIRVGKARYGLDEVARKLGMTSEELRRELNLELRRMKIEPPPTK